MNLETTGNISVIEQLQNSFATHTLTHAEHLAKDYVIKNPSEVADFIGENLFLLELLEEIPDQIFRCFGYNQKLRLEILSEPDFPDSIELWVSVLTELSALESRQIMDKFDENWWLDNLDRADCKLNVTVKYV
jgi:hypothetical protein